MLFVENTMALWQGSVQKISYRKEEKEGNPDNVKERKQTK